MKRKGTEPVTVVGSFLSPYVRKVLACLHVKGLGFRIDPIIPFYGDDAFGRISPLRRIPVLMDGEVTLSDSSVICEYLEERHPEPPLLPTTLADRARSRWLEEFADTRLGEVLIWRLFDQRVIGPAVWGRPSDEDIVRTALTEEIPDALDYLETELPAEGFLFGERISTGDIATASFFRNAAFARFQLDPERWPRTAAFVGRVLDQPCFARLRPFEEIAIRTPPLEHRARLTDGGAPVTELSYGTPTPRPRIASC